MRQGDLVFVYGTLRKGERNDVSKKANVTFVSEACINGEIFNLGWFPGAKVADGSASRAFDPEAPIIHGEVFRLNAPEVISMLDYYEGYPHFYDRRLAQTDTGDLVWVYTFVDAVMKEQLIPSGDWKERSAA